jgi:hypothetical protein
MGAKDRDERGPRSSASLAARERFLSYDQASEYWRSWRLTARPTRPS